MVHLWFSFKRLQWKILCYICYFAVIFYIVEAASLPMVISAQQAELYTLTLTITLAKEKT